MVKKRYTRSAKRKANHIHHSSCSVCGEPGICLKCQPCFKCAERKKRKTAKQNRIALRMAQRINHECFQNRFVPAEVQRWAAVLRKELFRHEP